MRELKIQILGKLLPALMIALGCCPAFGQSQLSGHVAVDGRYLPEVTRTERIKSALRPLDFKIGSDPAEAALFGSPVAFAPSLMPLPPTVRKDDGFIKAGRGYIDASLGSWLDARLLAGYGIIDNADTSLDIRFDGLSTSLYKPDNALYYRRRYDGTLGLDFRRRLLSGALVDASAQYHLARFSYEILKPENSNVLNPVLSESPHVPWQTVNDASARLGYRASGSGALRWNAGASFRYFAYSELPYSALKPTRETTVRLDGGLEADVRTGTVESGLGLGLCAALNTYSGSYRPGTNGLVTLTPGWDISRQASSGRDGLRWQVRIGAKADISFNQKAPFTIYVPSESSASLTAESGTERFGVLHIAPDCSASIGGSWGGIRLSVCGGAEEQTLGRLNDRDPYAAPVLTGSLPAFTPAEVRLALTLTPGFGFSMTLEGGWKDTQHLYCGGLWTSILQTAVSVGSPDSGPDYRTAYYNLHGFMARLGAMWKSLRWLEAEAAVSWQPQHRSTGWFNGYDRPEWTADIKLHSAPWRGLGIDLGWNLRACRSVTVSDALDYKTSVALGNISSLNLRLSYSFTPRFTIGAALDNLLDRKTMLVPGFISEGFTATGALQFMF